MPVLHQYKDKPGYYILTSIKGNIITFNLTPEGVGKIHNARIKAGQRFGRAILLDLYRSGEAFTYGSGPGDVVDDNQGEFDFTKDPDSEKMFPACADCSSLNNLHLIEKMEPDHIASILCGDCRTKKIATFDMSIPLLLVSRSTLNRLLTMKGIDKIDASVTAYKGLLDAEFQTKWDAYKKGQPKQGSLSIDDGSLI